MHSREIAPWPDYLGQTIHHGDRMSHPDGMEFVAVYFPGFASAGDSWRAVYCGGDSSHVSRLCLQIGDKGQAFVIDAAAPEGAQAVDDQAAAWLLLRILQQAGPFPRELIDRTKDALQRMAAPPPLGGEDGARDREDAARYRWLRDRALSFERESSGHGTTWCVIGMDLGDAEPLYGSSLDSVMAECMTIDAARAAGGEGS